MRAGVGAGSPRLGLGAFQWGDRLTPARLCGAVEETGRVLLDIAAITAVAGFVIGVLQLSGLGFKFSLVLVTVAGGSALGLLGLTAGVCIILRIGLPTAIL